MATLFRQTVTRYLDADGKRCRKNSPGAKKVADKTNTWYGKYRDSEGILRIAKLCSNKQASRQMLGDLERRAFFEKAGLVSPFESHAKRPLCEHVDEFVQSLRDANNTDEHCSLIGTRVRFVVDTCGFRFINDLSASRVQSCLANLRRKEQRSQQTINHYLRAIKQFTRWLVRDRRTAEDRLQFLQGGNVRADRRLERRELTDAEIAHFLEAARTGKHRRNLTGPDRRILYVTALATGLRASELASLTPRHFKLDGDIPVVKIDAANEKAGRGDVIPLPPNVAEMLRTWTANMPADKPVWPGNWAKNKRAGIFMKHDLAKARAAWIAEATSDAERQEREASPFLRYRNEDGQADFHSLRHTYLSRLGRSGASAKAMQKLARHSTVELTIGRYTHANLNDLSEVVDRMTPLPLGGNTVVAAKEPVSPPTPVIASGVVAQMVAPPSDNSCNSLTAADASCHSESPASSQNGTSRNSPSPQWVEGHCGWSRTPDEAEREGFEPSVEQARHRFSSPASEQLASKWPAIRLFPKSRKSVSAVKSVAGQFEV